MIFCLWVLGGLFYLWIAWRLGCFRLLDVYFYLPRFSSYADSLNDTHDLNSQIIESENI